MNDDITILPYHSGIVECRICGLKFLPELEEDQELHQHEHLRFLRGGLPYDLREFIKRAAWEAAEYEDGIQGDEGSRQHELAKRAIIFARWARSVSKGIPENDLGAYMAAHFAAMDARESGDRYQLEKANQAMARWRRYG